MRAEMLLEYGIECGEVARIFKPHAAPHHIFRAVSRFIENRKEIANSLLSLRDNVACNQFAANHGHLARHIKPAIGFHRSRKRKLLSARARAARRAIPLNAHTALLVCAVTFCAVTESRLSCRAEQLFRRVFPYPPDPRPRQ